MSHIDLSKSRALFLVWSQPTHGSSRSREFSKELGIDLHYIYTTLRPGVLTVPARYLYQSFRTLRLLFKRRPKFVFVQSPPGFAVLFVYLYCVFTGGYYIVDAHSGAFDLPIWNYPEWLYRMLARKALATIVTDEHFRQVVTSWHGNSFVLKDPVTTYSVTEYPLGGSFNLAVVNSFSSDEPLEEVLKAAADLKDVRFYITGKKSAAVPRLLEQAPPNVTFTDYLPSEKYYGLLKSSDAVMCLTTVDHTLQCGACEALSLRKPIITSNWTLLREYFSQGTVYVPNTWEGIRRGVIEMRKNYDMYLSGIQELHKVHKQTWRDQVQELISFISQSTSSDQCTR